jgi:predicted amidohydrolase YtcJ
VTSLIPEPSKEQLLSAFHAAARHLLSKGVTTVGDMGRYPFLSADPEASWRDLEGIYEPLAAAGQLPLRVVAYTPLQTW